MEICFFMQHFHNEFGEENGSATNALMEYFQFYYQLPAWTLIITTYSKHNSHAKVEHKNYNLNVK